MPSRNGEPATRRAALAHIWRWLRADPLFRGAQSSSPLGGKGGPQRHDFPLATIPPRMTTTCRLTPAKQIGKEAWPLREEGVLQGGRLVRSNDEMEKATKRGAESPFANKAN